MVLKGNGTYKHGQYYAIFCGSGCKYIILSARLEGSIGSNGDVDVRTQLQDGYECYLVTKNGTNLFDEQNTTAIIFNSPSFSLIVLNRSIPGPGCQQPFSAVLLP